MNMSRPHPGIPLYRAGGSVERFVYTAILMYWKASKLIRLGKFMNGERVTSRQWMTILNPWHSSRVSQDEGYQVQPVDSGKAGLTPSPPAGTDPDARMPGISGFESVAGSKRQRPAGGLRHVSRVQSYRGLREASLWRRRLVSKPFRREELLARVRTHLNWSFSGTTGTGWPNEQRNEQRHRAVAAEVEERRRADSRNRERSAFRQIANAAPVTLDLVLTIGLISQRIRRGVHWADDAGAGRQWLGRDCAPGRFGASSARIHRP
jgi:hypothetical protein